MKRYVFDMKISPMFCGSLEYTKHDYLNDTKMIYSLHFDEGKITTVHLWVWEEGELILKDCDYSKWNSDFWVKAPKSLRFDDCKWDRTDFYFIRDVNGGIKYYGTGNVKCVV